MKNRRVEEIKKRIAKRKAEQERMEEEQYFAGGDFDSETVFIEEGGKRKFIPYFEKKSFSSKFCYQQYQFFQSLFYLKMLLNPLMVLELLQKKL